MADTASSLISDALLEINVGGANEPLPASDMATAIRYLNRFMASLDSRGVSLGYTVVTSPSDAITIPDGALDGIMLNLAIKLAPQFQEVASAELIANAVDGMKAVYDIAVVGIPTVMPSTMPIGSGNEGNVADDHFYPNSDDTILNESGGYINLESGT